MSLGLPSHIAQGAMSRSLARAAQSFGQASLFCGVLVVIGFATTYQSQTIWPALVALLVMSGTLWWTSRSRRVIAPLVHLALGALGVYVYTVVFATELEKLVETNTIWLAFPKLALIMSAGSKPSLGSGLGWTAGGYLLAEGAMALALAHSDVRYTFDWVALTVFLLALGITVAMFGGLKLAHRSQPRIQRAAHDELLDDIRSRIELRAAALMHDTVLSHLAAIATSTSPTLPSEQKQEIERDLQILAGQEWLQEDAPTGEIESVTGLRQTPLHQAIKAARQQGLEILGTGDFAAIARLGSAQNIALGLAAKQCLVNVIKHSGVMRAEVAVYGSANEISVMIIDAGVGFTDSAVGADRLGLRASVLNRIESVGGTVQVWSTPGSGTSILLQLPVAISPAPAGGLPDDGAPPDGLSDSA